MEFVMVFSGQRPVLYTLFPIHVIAYIGCINQSSLVQLGVPFTQLFATEP